MNEFFRKTAKKVSQMVGSMYAFFTAIFLIIVWFVTGPYFEYSDRWQLMINTLTTVVTFIMVFIIQNTQNRDSRAMHLKLDELIRANKKARDTLINLEDESDQDLGSMEEEFKQVINKTINKGRESTKK